jgi:formylglycine-generating enzyme required for sulfatase activity
MSDIFISYANADRPRVKPLVDALQQQGWSVWWDRKIPIGKTWDQVIDEALTDARCVIVLWSRDSIQSDWVRTEAYEAKRRKILVPALLDDVRPPLAFRSIQAANLVDWHGTLPNAEFDELAVAVAEVLSNAPLRAQVVEVPSAQARPVDRVAALETQDIERARAESRWRSPKKTGSVARTRSLVSFAIGLALSIAGSWYLTVSHRHALPVSGPSAPVSNAPVTASHPLPRTGDVRGNEKTNRPPRQSGPPLPRAGDVRVNTKDGLNYVWIAPGTFTMGCSPGDSACRDNEKPSHQVTITRGFQMGQTDVTQDAYQRVMGENPSHFKGPNLPVETVNWDEAQAYCKAVGARLPTEAEWEYAARGGSPSSRYGALEDIAWYDDPSGETHSVKQKQPNPFGLYDMLGSVFQWTADYWYRDYSSSPVSDPSGPAQGTEKTLRGGSWNNFPRSARVSFRNWLVPGSRGSNIGFRCVGE